MDNGSSYGNVATKNKRSTGALFIKKKGSSIHPFLHIRLYIPPINITIKILFHDHIGHNVMMAVNSVIPKSEEAIGIVLGCAFFHSVMRMYCDFLLLHNKQTCRYKKRTK